MLPPLTLPTNASSLSLRMQAPDLVLLGLHGQADPGATRVSDGWQRTVGSVSLLAKIVSVGTDLWHVQMTLRNDGPSVEAFVSYPYLYHHFPHETAVRFFNPTFGGVLEASNSQVAVTYPGPATFCLTAASGRDATVAMGILDEPLRQIVVGHIPGGNEGQIQFTLPRVRIDKGQVLELPTAFIKVASDWAVAFAPYRQWLSGRFEREESRPHWWAHGNFTETRKAHCVSPFEPGNTVAGIWMFNDQGKPRDFATVKAEIDQAVEQGKREGFTPLFYQFAWWRSMADMRGTHMFDTFVGDYTQAHDLAKQSIDYIHQCGARVYLYTNIISAGDLSQVIRNQPELFVRDAAGAMQQNASYPMRMFCPGAPGMRQYWDRVLEYMLGTLGADGLFLDQVGGGDRPCFCYESSHHHAHPDTYSQDFLELVRHINTRAREIRPDAFIGGELVLDARSKCLDESHGIGYSGLRSKPPTDSQTQRQTPPAEYYIFVRHLAPEITSGIGHDRLAMMNGAAGSNADPLWRKYRHVFEAGATPCQVDPCGGLAYLFGPHAGQAVLAVRSHGDIGIVEVRLPTYVRLTGALPPGLSASGEGMLACRATLEPQFFVLDVGQDGNATT
jgi:hypothetical protein